MKLRHLFIASHMVSILVTAVVIALTSLGLQIASARKAEHAKLEIALSTASEAFNRRVDQLQQVQGVVTDRIATGEFRPGDMESLARLHEFMALFNIGRVEVFRGLNREWEAFRWQRSTDLNLVTAWLPPHPRIAAEVTGGQKVVWVQRGPDWSRSLKFLAPIQGTDEVRNHWVVVTEPLDSSLLAILLPEGLAGNLEVDQHSVAAWSEGRSAGLDGGENSSVGLHSRKSSFSFFRPAETRRTIFQADDGTKISLVAGLSSDGLDPAIILGLRTWLLITILSLLLGGALGHLMAGKLMRPLMTLLEGTAAIARGHLTVRLAETGTFELSALTREFNRMADEIRNTYLGLISTLAEVVEAKSHYTREHIERVERLSMLTAEALERRGWVKLSSHQRFLLSVAAILHDVGKIAISNDILNKSGPLSDIERRQILTHPEVGALIVERMGKLERAAEIIRHAHEHFDGTGYPRGLKGEEIPLGSRIILAVDAFDAMTVDRPYSSGRPVEEAIEELRSESGRQFDPVVVEALIDAVQSERWRSDEDGVLDSGLYRVLHGSQPPSASGQRAPARPE